MDIKTLQWNIGGAHLLGQDGKYDFFDLDYITKVVSEIDADVCFLQETHIDDNLDQAEYIADKLGYFFVSNSYDNSHIEDGQKLSQAILSKTPLSEHSFNFFHNPNWEHQNANGTVWRSHNKGITGASTEIDGNKIVLQTLHQVPFRLFGQSPLSETSRPIAESVDTLISSQANLLLLGGDFNFNEKDMNDFLPRSFANGVKELASSVPTTPKGRFYDRYLYKGFDLEKYDVLSDVKTDHFPVIANFKI